MSTMFSAEDPCSSMTVLSKTHMDSLMTHDSLKWPRNWASEFVRGATGKRWPSQPVNSGPWLCFLSYIFSLGLGAGCMIWPSRLFCAHWSKLYSKQLFMHVLICVFFAMTLILQNGMVLWNVPVLSLVLCLFRVLIVSFSRNTVGKGRVWCKTTGRKSQLNPLPCHRSQQNKNQKGHTTYTTKIRIRKHSGIQD